MKGASAGQLHLLRLPEPNDPLGSAAEFYAREGVAVHPLRQGSRIPATRRGVLDATTHIRQIRAWWHANPKYNIGLAAGSYQWTCVDPAAAGQPFDWRAAVLHLGAARQPQTRSLHSTSELSAPQLAGILRTMAAAEEPRR
jgi:Bifunctional DNA primase/polymerase, N-terminal